MKKGKQKIILMILFIIYLIILSYLMVWGRYRFQVMIWNKGNFTNYLGNSVNIIPFHTIIEYTRGYINGYVSTYNFVVNIIGNIIAFIPFAYFLPMLFSKINNFKNFIITMIGIVITMELIQFITLSGSCDIDDVILNVLGVGIMFKILNINNNRKKNLAI